MKRTIFCFPAAVLTIFVSSGCSSNGAPAASVTEDDALQLVTEPLTVRGQLTRNGTSVKYRVSASSVGNSATVNFDIHGIPLDVTVDLAKQSVVEDAHGSRFEQADRDLMLALRDRVLAQHPQIVQTLQGRLLVKAADRYAEVPLGVPLELHHAVAGPQQPINVTGGCRDDGVACLSGTDGSSWAIFSNAADCRATRTSYGDGSGGCLGRCGIGCSFWDHDYTYDCLDHDVCLSYQSDCSKEFHEAADDWVVTFGPYCPSSSPDRPTPTAAPRCGDGRLDPGEECDDGNNVGGDGCSATCTKENVTPVLRVRAYIDGTSDLILAGAAVHWHHIAWSAPGLYAGANEPTFLNDIAWTPAWPSPGDNKDCNCDSQPSPSVPPLPARDQTVTVSVANGRGHVSIKDQPSAANGYTFRVEVDDYQGGPSNYDLVFSYATQ